VAKQLAAARDASRSAKKGRPVVAPPLAEIAPSQGGMGLGFFIARTLLERTGGQVAVGHGDGGPGGNRGARVTIRWPREALEV
jgi:two-component system sensor histidine kinase RegB